MFKRGEVNFLGIVSFIGSVLILLGIAWIIASNWRHIPGFLKIFILTVATLSALILGAFLKEREHKEFTGRSLLFLGGGLYVLSVFLIAQVLFTQSSSQGIVNLIFLCWPALFLIAYFLDSKENLISGFIVFGVWVISQYFILAEDENAILTIILLFVMIGAVLYGIRQLHKVYKHRFYRLYTFWTVFYILLGTFLLTFQSIISIGILRSEGEIGFTNPFFIIMALCFTFFFIVSMIISLNKDKKDTKEALIFIGIIFIILISVFLIRVSGSLDISGDDNGSCRETFDNNACSRNFNQDGCEGQESCLWVTGTGGNCETNYTNSKPFCGDVNGIEICQDINCRNFLNNETQCSVMNDYGCYWQLQGTCQDSKGGAVLDLQSCYDIDAKASCETQSNCQWRKSDSYRTQLNWFTYILWIVYNVFFIFLIILMIGYGKQEKQRRIIDIAFMFFVLDIISRYIGFAMNLVGYLGFSIVAIIGGIGLIVGSYLIQKFWRQEVKEVHEVRNEPQ